MKKKEITLQLDVKDEMFISEINVTKAFLAYLKKKKFLEHVKLEYLPDGFSFKADVCMAQYDLHEETLLVCFYSKKPASKKIKKIFEDATKDHLLGGIRPNEEDGRLEFEIRLPRTCAPKKVNNSFALAF
jgi:hypothetical protein